MKEYIKYFSAVTASDGYKIVDIPFISTIESDGIPEGWTVQDATD